MPVPLASTGMRTLRQNCWDPSPRFRKPSAPKSMSKTQKPIYTDKSYENIDVQILPGHFKSASVIWSCKPHICSFNIFDFQLSSFTWQMLICFAFTTSGASFLRVCIRNAFSKCLQCMSEVSIRLNAMFWMRIIVRIKLKQHSLVCLFICHETNITHERTLTATKPISRNSFFCNAQEKHIPQHSMPSIFETRIQTHSSR